MSKLRGKRCTLRTVATTLIVGKLRSLKSTNQAQVKYKLENYELMSGAEILSTFIIYFLDMFL